MSKRVLVVEDESDVARVLEGALTRGGFEVISSPDGQAALEAFEQHRPTLVLLDLQLPKLDGMEVAQKIRLQSTTPIIMVTARVTEADKLAGLRWADDYITKPFSLDELIARVNCVLRRAQGGAPCPKLQVQDLTIELERREVQIRGEHVHLTEAEFELLAFLAQHRGRVFDRCQLLKVVDSYDGDVAVRTIDAHIKNLRRKIESDPQHPQYIVSVYGMGYKFVG